ncbi:MAG: hypothetical protein HAW67_07425 [Endozoicomonadaceae bacterium]|nr:hypothetical protein [Endozoicomonadaceae bacterium]
MINNTALATTAVTDLMYQLYCYRNDMRVYAPSLQGKNRTWYNMQDNEDEFNLMMLVDNGFKALIQAGGTQLSLDLYKQWTHELVESDVIVTRCDFKHQQIVEILAYKLMWEKQFKRERYAQDFISDPLVPRGQVHYRYLYQFDNDKGYYTSTRLKASDQFVEFWEQELYWFDYFGVPEDERGLIYYIDYE